MPNKINTGGFLQYRCRNCGVIFQPVHVPELLKAVMDISEKGVYTKDESRVFMSTFHICEGYGGEVLGIADFIAGVYGE